MRFAGRLWLWLAVACAAKASIILPGSFGPYGDVGFQTSAIASDSITFGDGNGFIYQMDAFINVAGSCDYASTQDLACGPPAGISYTFGASQPTSHQLLLTYSFVNNTAAAISPFDMVFYVDPDIGSTINDEWATVGGSVGNGVLSYEVGDPSLSPIFYNAINNNLNSLNQEPSTSPGDVSIALALTSETLGIGQRATFEVMLSDDGSSIGTLNLTQSDPVYTNDKLTLSGVGVPEPSTWILLTSGLLLLWKKRG